MSVLPVLLALPFLTAALVVAVSSLRRRHHAGAGGAVEPVHRWQSAPAVVQSAAARRPVAGRVVLGGRERRAGSRR